MPRRASIALALFLFHAGCARPNGNGPADAAQDIAVDAAVLDADGTVVEPVDASRGYVPEPFAATDATRAYCARGGAGVDPDAVEETITRLLAELTPGEKRGLLGGASVGRVDGVWLARGVARLSIADLRMIDGPRGASVARGAATAFPVGALRGASWDPALERRVGEAIADETIASGANVLLAPTMNILRHPRWGRAQETYSEDTAHLGAMATAFVLGAQSRGVLATLKHLAANSIEDTRHTVDVRMDERTLREVYLPHFRQAVVEGGASSVMTAYNQLNGRYCDMQPHLLQTILRDEWGFAGFVVSDWVLGTHSSVESLRAGLDLEMPTPIEFSSLGAALGRGEITERDLDRAARRLLRARLCYGLAGRTHADDPSARDTMARRALARESARRGIVLLRNEPYGAGATTLSLPLDRATLRSIVVLGRLATVENTGDRGSSDVRTSDVVTALEGITERAGAGVTVTHLSVDAAAIATTPSVRDASAVVIVTGSAHEDEGEGEIGAGDRDSMALSPAEVALVRAARAVNDRVIVVLEGGSAIETAPWDTDATALLWAGYPGAEGGRAIADVLFGDTAPSGRLAFSIPERESDLPAFDRTSASVTYGYLHGYRHLQARSIRPRYAFGFGLGYSTVAYESLSLEAASVSASDTVVARVTVRNTGARSIRETPQLYVAAVGSSVMRAPMDLRAFAQVELAPGEARQISLSFSARSLAYYDERASAFVVEPIAYEARVGPDSERASLRASFRVR